MNRSLLIAAALLTISSAGFAYDVETIQETGDSGNRLDLVVLGDGYRDQDQEKMTDDVNDFLAGFWAVTPYKEYRNFFNIKLVHVISAQDGADGGMYGADSERDTTLGAYFFCGGIERLLCIDNQATLDIAGEDTPEYDFLMVMVNDTKYGGAGGSIATFSVASSAAEIANHEFGHSFGGLADEYDTPYDGFPDCVGDCPEPNATLHTTFDDIKWNPWIEPDTPLPTPEQSQFEDVIGAFEGCRYKTQGVYRPWQSCKMNILGVPFCSVCAEAMVVFSYDTVSPIDSVEPDAEVELSGSETQKLEVFYPAPSPDTMTFVWTVDGSDVDESGSSYVADAAELGNGSHEISVTLHDDTPLVRKDPDDLLTDAHTWKVEVTDADDDDDNDNNDDDDNNDNDNDNDNDDDNNNDNNNNDDENDTDTTLDDDDEDDDGDDDDDDSSDSPEEGGCSCRAPGKPASKQSLFRILK